MDPKAGAGLMFYRKSVSVSLEPEAYKALSAISEPYVSCWQLAPQQTGCWWAIHSGGLIPTFIATGSAQCKDTLAVGLGRR